MSDQKPKFNVGDRVMDSTHFTFGTVTGFMFSSADGDFYAVRWDERNEEQVKLASNLRRVVARKELPSVSSTGGRKNVKPQKYSLLPVEALAQVAEHYGAGAQKYAAHQWRQGYEWSKSYDALQRHANAFWGGENNDAETGTPHMAAVAFHALTLLTFMAEHPDHDDRYKP